MYLSLGVPSLDMFGKQENQSVSIRAAVKVSHTLGGKQTAAGNTITLQKPLKWLQVWEDALMHIKASYCVLSQVASWAETSREDERQ